MGYQAQQQTAGSLLGDCGCCSVLEKARILKGPWTTGHTVIAVCAAPFVYSAAKVSPVPCVCNLCRSVRASCLAIMCVTIFALSFAVYLYNSPHEASRDSGDFVRQIHVASRANAGTMVERLGITAVLATVAPPSVSDCYPLSSVHGPSCVHSPFASLKLYGC